MRRRKRHPLLTWKDVDVWLAGPGRPFAAGLRKELRAGWFFAERRLRRRILAELGERWNKDPRFPLDVEQSLRAMPECLLECARRLATNQLLALASVDPVRRIIAVPRAAAAEALARRLHRELAPLHDVERYPGLLWSLLQRLAVETEHRQFRALRRASTAIPSAPRALILGGERKLQWGSDGAPRGTWWILETRMSSNDFTRDEARASIARTLRPAVRALHRDLRKRAPESRSSIGDRAVEIAAEPVSTALPPGPRPWRKPQSGVVVVTSAQLDE
ncbi:MAG: hypothetical protein ACRDGR_02170 [bacterium]